MLADLCISFANSELSSSVDIRRKTLVSLLNALGENHFMVSMSHEGRNVRMPSKCDPCVIGAIMLSCDAYKVSNRTCNIVSDTTFGILWRKLHVVVHQLVDPATAARLLKGRTEQGYRASMVYVQYSDSDTLCVSSSSDLIARQARLSARRSSAVVGSATNMVMQGSSAAYYSSITSALLHMLGVEFRSNCMAYIEPCGHDNKCTAVDVYTGISHELCMLCGAVYNGNLSIKLRYQQIILSDEQVSKPTCFVDKAAYFPIDARIEWNKFTTRLRCPLQSTLNVVHRGCILVGVATTDECKYCMWFVRPTVSYSKWNYVASKGKADALCERLKQLFQDWRPYTEVELKVNVLTSSTKPTVQVSGKWAAIYHDKVRDGPEQVSYCSVVSFAETTLRLQKVTTSAGCVDIKDIALNVNLVHSLMPVIEVHPLVVRHTIAASTMKLLRGNRSGASITLGANGGLQYLGRMDQACKVYTRLCALLRSSMTSTEFTRHLSRAHYITGHVFPSGVSRGAAQPDP